MEDVLGGGAAVAAVGAFAAEAHVDHLDVLVCGVLGHPVEAADHAGEVARPVGAEDPHGVERRARRHADDPRGAPGADDPGDMGTVPVAVGGGGFSAAQQSVEAATRCAVDATHHVEVGAIHDPGVEDGHCCPVAGLVGVGGRPRADPGHSGGHGRRGRCGVAVEEPDGTVGCHVGHPRVAGEARRFTGRERHHQRVRRPLVENDDVAAGAEDGTSRHGGERQPHRGDAQDDQSEEPAAKHRFDFSEGPSIPSTDTKTSRSPEVLLTMQDAGRPGDDAPGLLDESSVNR
jgi:hypothetical protein